jgi:hypothetical protein
MASNVVLLPDAGPLITLAYADALDLLFKPGWPVVLVDMVLHEVTRNQTPTSEKLTQWAAAGQVSMRTTRTFQHHQQMLAANPAAARTANLGELAIQETMNDFALKELDVDQPRQTGRVPVRGPQNRPRQLFAAGQLPQDQHARLPDVSGAARLA